MGQWVIWISDVDPVATLVAKKLTLKHLLQKIFSLRSSWFCLKNYILVTALLKSIDLFCKTVKPNPSYIIAIFNACDVVQVRYTDPLDPDKK